MQAMITMNTAMKLFFLELNVHKFLVLVIEERPSGVKLKQIWTKINGVELNAEISMFPFAHADGIVNQSSTRDTHCIAILQNWKKKHEKHKYFLNKWEASRQI
jgi:hypothetical protein